MRIIISFIAAASLSTSAQSAPLQLSNNQPKLAVAAGYGVLSYDFAAEYLPYKLVAGYSTDLARSHYYVLRRDPLVKAGQFSWNVLWGYDLPNVISPTWPGGIGLGSDLEWTSRESAWRINLRMLAVSYQLGQSYDKFSALFPSVQLARLF